jgi:hypothetical protein
MQTKPTNRLVDGSLALRARQRASGADTPKTSNPKAKKIAIVIVIFGLLVGGGFGAVWAWNYMGKQAKLAKLNEMRDKMKDPSLTDADRQALWAENRQLLDGLSRDDRRAFFTQGGGFGRGRNEEDRMKKFLAMTPAEQTAQLDKDIDRMLADQKDREARRKQREDAAAKADASGKQADDKGGDNGGKDGGSGQSGQTAKTDAQKKLDRNSRLSSMPPQQRVQWSQNRELNQAYRNMMQARASQRGVTLPQFGGGGPRGGGPRG